MKLWKRKTLLILAFSLFFIIAPILVFYAMGYRYDFKNKIFRQIGMIILESKPDSADIYINNDYNSKTPFRIKNLLPNEYSVKISKDGFNSWEKILNVESKKVTWASNIVLFYKEPETKDLSDIKFNNSSISPNYKKIIASSNDQENYGLWLFDLDTGQSKNIYPGSNSDLISPISENDYRNLEYSNFKWSPNSKKLILSIKNKKSENTLILDTDENIKPIYLNDTYDLITQDVQWKSNEEIYLLDNTGNIHQIELNLKYPPKIILNQAVIFQFNKENNEIIYISREENGFQLISYVDNAKNNILNLPKDENFEIGMGMYNNLALLLKNKKELLLIDTITKEPRVIGNNINTFNWSKSKNKLLYLGKNELWFYALKKETTDQSTYLAYNFNESNLLTRYSTEIKNATWYSNEEYIALLLEDKMKILELDGREKRNSQEYNNNLLNKDYSIGFDKKGENIYLINKNNILQKVKITEF